jgi:hypothetical protein
MTASVVLPVTLVIVAAVVAGINARKRRKLQSPPSFVCADCGSTTYGDATPGFGLRFVVSVLVAAALWLLVPSWSAALLTLALLTTAVLLNETFIMFSGRPCEHCRSRRVIPLDTSMGRELARDYHGMPAYELGDR